MPMVQSAHSYSNRIVTAHLILWRVEA